MSAWSRRTIEGAAAGALATLPMSAVMVAAQALGLLGRQPPAKITDAAVDQVAPATPRRARDVLSVLAHLGFGAAAGALFGLLRRGRPSPRRAMLEGAAFGTAVWTASYAGWVPALDIMPAPSEDRRGRPSSMVIAHWVYGAALGAIVAGARRER